MGERSYRIAIVGATSLLGKELSNELQESPLAGSDFLQPTGGVDFVDERPTIRRDEAALNQLEFSSFRGVDLVFLAGTPESSLRHWKAAGLAGASVVDLTGGLDEQEGVIVRAPLVSSLLKREAAHLRGIANATVVSAHPAAIMLASVAGRLAQTFTVTGFASTVFEPASQQGGEAMDELHQQTVNLLSFRDLPRSYYDAQVAFNLLPSFGQASQVNLLDSENRIRAHYGSIVDQQGPEIGRLPNLGLQLIQAPVFHGYAASILITLEQETKLDLVEASLAGKGINICRNESEAPSNLAAAGQENIMIRVRSTVASTSRSCQFWLWVAADNLKLSAKNAASCAIDLKAARTQGKVQ